MQESRILSPTPLPFSVNQCSNPSSDKTLGQQPKETKLDLVQYMT